MLVPRMTAKYLFDAEPGELVRTNGPNGPVLGLVSGLHFNDPRMQKLLIHLTLPGQQPKGPCYSIIHEHAGSTAVSFGRDYLFVADPSADAIDPLFGGDFYAAGALVIGDEHKLLQVIPAYPEAHHAVLSYDVERGSTVGFLAPPRPNCVLLKWEIRLTATGDLDPPLPPLFRMEIPSRSARSATQ
jgi:hypothetical protein